MNKKIVIIGAGAAGFAAATKLYQNGFKNLIILEAENRIGGRINTVPYASNVVDMGAQWCHGEEDNVVYEMAKNHNLLESNKMHYDSFILYQSNGQIIPKEIAEQLMGLVITIVESYKIEMRQYQGSLGHFITEKYKSALETPEYKNIDLNLSLQFLDFFHRYENSIEASDSWFDTSCRGYVEYWDCDGDRLLNWKDKGYRTVFDLLMKKIPITAKAISIEDKIQLNKEVKTITIKKHQSSNQIVVQCSDGSIFDADHVISTMSLGVLKEQHKKMFTPQLSEKKIQAIEALTLGTVDKIYLEFDKPFWESDWIGLSLLWTQNDRDEIRKHPEHAWLEDIYGFFCVDYQPNILCGWVSGVSARHMEKLTNDEVTKGSMWLIRKFLPNWKIPQPKSMKRSQWYSNPHFRGSYTFRSTKCDLLPNGTNDIATPVTDSLGKPILHFAGEATHEHYYSTVHGAIETGWREAKRIIDFYNPLKIDTISNLNEQIINTNPSTIKQNNYFDVLILGAGLAGLGAAIKLKSSSLTYLILEGESYAGGRVHTTELINNSENNQSIASNSKDQRQQNGMDNHHQANMKTTNIIDTGAQWLHGKFNALHDVAESYGLLSKQQSEEGLGVFIRDDGVIFDEYFVDKIDFLVGQILTECEKYAKDNHTNYPSSVNHFLMENFQNYLDKINDNEEEKLQARQLLDWHVRFNVIDNSCMSLDRVSAKTWGKYSFNGENCQAHYNFKNGFNSAVKALVNEISQNNFHFQKNVCEINGPSNAPPPHSSVASTAAASSSSSSSTSSLKPIISVKCSDSSVYYANHVIVTFSLGSLKYGLANDLFKPKLPQMVQQTIKDLGFETINKLFFQFDECWWGDWKGIQLVFKNNNYENTNWTRHISGFDVISPGPANTLLGWVGGAGAIQMEHLTDEQIIQDCMSLLYQFTNIQIPSPVKYFCTRWHSNPFIRGAYSYSSVDCDQNSTSNCNLIEPILWKQWHHATTNETIENRGEYNLANDLPILQFAGEACHEIYFSTAHGAFLSGQEQATNILDFNLKKKN